MARPAFATLLTLALTPCLLPLGELHPLGWPDGAARNPTSAVVSQPAQQVGAGTYLKLPLFLRP